MNSEVGFGRKVLSAFEENNISFEHMPSGIDTMTIFVHQPEFEGKEQAVISAIHRLAKPDSIELEGDLALIAVVGRGRSRPEERQAVSSRHWHMQTSTSR